MLITKYFIYKALKALLLSTLNTKVIYQGIKINKLSSNIDH